MSNVISFPAKEPTGEWLATVEIYRERDGTISARLADMPADVIEEMGGEPSDKMTRLSIWMKGAQKSFVDQALALVSGR